LLVFGEDHQDEEVEGLTHALELESNKGKEDSAQMRAAYFRAMVLVSTHKTQNNQKHYKNNKDQKYIVLRCADAQVPPTHLPNFPVAVKEHLAVDLMTAQVAQPVRTLVDSGATDLFIDAEFAKAHGIPLLRLTNPKLLFLFDWTPAASGRIAQRAKLEITLPGFAGCMHSFLVTPLPSAFPPVLGHDFLRKHNPDCNCKAQTIRPRAQTGPTPTPSAAKVLRNNLFKRVARACRAEPQLHHASTLRSATALVFDEDKDKATREQIKLALPAKYHAYVDVFLKVNAETLPPHCAGIDLQVDLVKGAAIPPKGGIYGLKHKHLLMQEAMIKEELRKGFIRECKGPYAAAMFAVPKKDGSVRWVTDYRNINAITIKNQYPLPNINHLLLQLKRGKIFSKIFAGRVQLGARCRKTRVGNRVPHQVRILRVVGDAVWTVQRAGLLPAVRQ
jgi:hypothetical protein